MARRRSRQPELARGCAHGLVVGAQQLDRAHPQAPPGAVEDGDVDPRGLDGRPPSQAGGPAMGLEERAARRAGSVARTRVATLDGRRPSAASVAARRGRAGRAGSRRSRVDERQPPAGALEHRGRERAAPAEGRQRLGDGRHRSLRPRTGSRRRPGCRAARRPGTRGGTTAARPRRRLAAAGSTGSTRQTITRSCRPPRPRWPRAARACSRRG